MTAPSPMQLYLLRHADQGDPDAWTGPEEAQPLSEKGRLQAERLGLFLADAGFESDLVLSSPRVRAAETARLVATPLGLPVVIREELREGPDDVAALETLLRDVGDPARPLLVGHDPDFSHLAAALAGATELPLRKCTLARIDVARPLAIGDGVLRWLLPPDLLGGE